MFARLAVFAIGATVAAAEAVTEASLDALHSLVAKQLLIRDGDRLRMLETVREYPADGSQRTRTPMTGAVVILGLMPGGPAPPPPPRGFAARWATPVGPPPAENRRIHH